LVLEGEVKVNGTVVATDHVAHMEREGEEFTVEVTKDAVVLVISGEPLNEPIAHYGPFVMNTTDELVQAVDDFNSGKFGDLA
ncbi:pirin-like C-terminal cupin domain-containing protein, partial [Myroides odoratimimus]